MVLALAFAVAPLAGCPLEEPYADGERGHVVAVYPDDGAAAVPLDTAFLVEIGQDLAPPVQLVATLSHPGADPRELTCSPSDDDTLFHCPHPQDLEPDTRYTFDAALEGESATLQSSTFSTAHPAGLGYELASGLEVERLGGVGIASPLLTTAIAGGAPLLLVSVDVHGDRDLPAVGTNLVWGPGKQLAAGAADEYAVHEAVGYPMAAVTMIDERGTLFGSKAHSFLPVWIDDRWHPLRVDDLVMRGVLHTAEPGLPVTELRVEANVSQVALERVTAQLDGPEASLLDALVEMDTDTDLDGKPDAARLVMTTEAVPASIHAP